MDAEKSYLKPEYPMIEIANIRKNGANPASCHMAIEQNLAWEQLGIQVSIVNRAEISPKEMAAVVVGSGNRTMVGIPIVIDKTVSADRIEFRDNQGNKVGEIVNLLNPVG